MTEVSTTTDPQILALVDQISSEDGLNMSDIVDMILDEYESELDALAEQSIGGWSYAPVPGSVECYEECKRELDYLTSESVSIDHGWESGIHGIPSETIAEMLHAQGIIDADDVTYIVDTVDDRAIDHLCVSERRHWIAEYEAAKHKADVEHAADDLEGPVSEAIERQARADAHAQMDDDPEGAAETAYDDNDSKLAHEADPDNQMWDTAVEVVKEHAVVTTDDIEEEVLDILRKNIDAMTLYCDAYRKTCREIAREAGLLENEDEDD